MTPLVRRLVVLISSLGLVLTLTPIASAAAPNEHQRILDHWTPARMASAVPRDFVRVGDRYMPDAAKPRPGGDTVTGASWTGKGTVLTATGKVYFEMDGGAYICSGSVIEDSSADRSFVLTAGHCAYDETNGAFATNWMFIPDFDAHPTYTCSATQYGCWTSTALVVDSGYATAGGFNDQATVHDWAIAVVKNGGNGSTDLATTVGAFPIGTPALATGDRAFAFGYPAAGRYKGSDLTYCAGSIFDDTWNDNKTWGLACSMTGGSSGGPWFASFNTTAGSGTASSLNSYRYSGLNAMYGPKFNGNTDKVVAAAKTAAADTVVVVAP